MFVLVFSYSSSFIRPKENKSLFPAHRVTKINVMRAAAKIIFLEHLKRKISSEIFKKVDELQNMKYATIRYHSYKCYMAFHILKREINIFLFAAG